MRIESIVSDDESDGCTAAGGHGKNEALWKRKIARGDRPKCVFMTWPNTKNAAFSKPDSYSRKGFARAIELSCHELHTKVESMAIFKENHKDGGTHYHALIILEAKSSRVWDLDSQMFLAYKAKTYTEVVTGGSRKPHFRVLEYLMCPTPRKLAVDDAPYFSQKMIVPDSLWDKAAKAKTKLENTQATPDEIYAFLEDKTSVRSHEDLLDLVDTTPGTKQKCGLQGARISKFINNNIGKAYDLINGLIARRGRGKTQEESLKTPMKYLELFIRDCETKCARPTGPGLKTFAEDIDFLVHFHTVRDIWPFFQWADKFFAGELPSRGRPKNCLIMGRPTSGKSVLTDLVAQIIPPNRIFSPILDSSAPFGHLRNHFLLSTCDDWRFSLKVPVTGTLQWLEGRAFAVDVKGKDPIPIKQGPICLYSTNHDTANANWRGVDIEAFLARCYIVRLQNRVPQLACNENISEKMEACPFCRIKSLGQRCESVRKAWERIKGEPMQGVDTYHPPFFYMA